MYYMIFYYPPGEAKLSVITTDRLTLCYAISHKIHL